MDFFDILPQEIIDIIFQYLNINDLGNCIFVSKRWHKQCNNKYIIKKMVNKLLQNISKINKKEWKFINKNKEITYSIIMNNKDKVFWNNISRNLELSEEFIEKYENKVNWDDISGYQKLSEEFIEKYKDRVFWYFIFGYQKLSEEFIE